MSELSTAEVLRRARKLIEDPERWIRESFHEDGCYCAGGAVLEAQGLHPEADEAPVEFWWQLRGFHELSKAMGVSTGLYVSDFNDHHSHAEVLAAFDKAIAEAEKA